MHEKQIGIVMVTQRVAMMMGARLTVSDRSRSQQAALLYTLYMNSW